VIKELEATYDARSALQPPQQELAGPLSQEVEDFLRKIDEDFRKEN
jgi:hypothetical protein